MQLKGIDVSKYDGTINWSKVKSSGIDFVIIRAGFGSSTVDEKFKEYIEGAIKVGLDIGIYWFSYAINESNAKAEALKCMQVLSPYKSKISYPVFYDFEYDSINYAKKQGVSINETKATNFAIAFLEEIRSGGYIPGLYTNIDFSNNYFTKSILDKYDVWIAQYTSRCSYSGSHTMWQYSESGAVSGISGKVDMNYCYKAYSSNKPTPTPPNHTDDAKTILIKNLQKSLNSSYESKLAVNGSYDSETKGLVAKHPLSDALSNKELDHVKWLQQTLKNLGYTLDVDGHYGPKTKDMVMKYQKDKKLTVDGIAGPSTHQSLVK